MAGDSSRGLARRFAPEEVPEEETEEETYDNHLADSATATLNREIDYSLEENSEHVLGAVNDALGRIERLWSATTPDWLRVIADGLPRDDPRVPSATFLWKGAEWMEREAYDMFGITFEGNRDLRRIYMPPDYQSFPLRKDFYLPDDAARSPGAGVRPMERTHTPRNAPATATVRRAGA